MTATRLAIVCSHPVQYYAPWFRDLARGPGRDLRVFYLWNPAADASGAHDPEFGRPVAWDTDLLSGYAHEFVPNLAARPGTSRFGGLRNPSLPARLRAWRPDAVLTFGYGWRTHLALALTWRDCPLILRGDSHDLGRDVASPLRRRLRSAALRLLFTRFAAFAAVGAANRDHYLRHGVPPARIRHVPHCVDNAAFARTAAVEHAAAEWRASLGIPPRHRVVGFIGKLVPKKRPDHLLEAFARLAPSDTTLLIVGDGELRDSLATRARDVPHVVFASFQNQSLMPRALAALDLLVLPSQGPGETWGLVVNEAMALGVPCVVSDHVGCRADLVEDDVTGWSFPAGDMDALSSSMARALARLSTAAGPVRTAVLERMSAASHPRATAALHRILDDLPARAASSPP
jgi:glycosyltransferase involved in cell wall biosynthesis